MASRKGKKEKRKKTKSLTFDELLRDVDIEYSYLIGRAIEDGHSPLAVQRALLLTQRYLKGRSSSANERRRIFFSLLSKLAFSREFWEEEKDARRKIAIRSLIREFRKAGLSEKEIRKRILEKFGEKAATAI